MSIIDRTLAEVKAVGRDHAGPPRHADDAGPGDPDGGRQPYTAGDVAWWASNGPGHDVDYDVIEAPELEWPGPREEYEAWLAGLAPTDDELALRDRTGDFGHPA